MKMVKKKKKAEDIIIKPTEFYLWKDFTLSNLFFSFLKICYFEKQQAKLRLYGNGSEIIS